MRHYLQEELYERIKTDDKIFDFLQQGSLDGMWYWDLENPENEWMNERFWTVLGYNPEEMPHLASAWQDIINQDDLKIAVDNFNKHLSDSNYPYDQEVRYTHKNGSTVWIRCRGIAIRDKKGNAIRMLGAHQDISELKRAEEKIVFLNRSISELITISEKQQLFDYFTNTIQSIYSETIIVYVSINENLKEAKLESISGLDSSILGKINKIAGRKFVGKQFKLTKEHQRLFRRGQFITYEGGLADFSSNVIPASASVIIQKLLNIHHIYTIGINKNNKLLGALHILTLNGGEITDRDFLETYTASFSTVIENLNYTIKLKESEEKFRTIYEHSPVMIDAFDENGKCVLWNKECEKKLGYTIDEINNSKDPFSLFYPDDKIKDDVIRTVVDNPDKKFREWNPKTKNGKLLTSLWANFNVSDKQTISIGVDITKRKKAEKKLKEKNDQLETIIKGAKLGWWDWDIPSGNEVYNDILTENLGYKLDEIKPHIKWWEDKIHPDDEEQVSIDLREHFEGKTEFYENKHRLKTKTGQWKWFLDYGKVVERDDEGNPIRMIGTLRDIDYEERAREKINTNLQQIKAINANTPNIIWKSDIDEESNFQNTYISEAADEFLALPKGSIGNSWDSYFSYVLPDYLPIIKQLFKSGIENTDKIISFEYEVEKADGKRAWFSSTGKVVEENNSLTVYGSTIDITEKKQAEAAVRDSEIRFKALHNASFGGIAIHDKGKVLECNHGLSEITGFNRNELIGMDGLLLIAEESRPKVLENIMSKYEKPYEAIGIRKNKEKYPLRLEAREIPYKGKDVRVVEFRDISEQKGAESKLKESEEMLRNIFNNSTSVIYSHDTNNIINYVSPQVEEVLGYTQEEAKVNWASLVSDNPINELGYRKTIKAIETGEKQEPYELEFKHKNGRKVLIEAREAPVIKDGKTISMVGIFNDITQRKQDEQELIKAKKKAEESDRLKSAFLANMSHEIRTPMNGILGFTELLENPNLSGEQKEKYIKIIRKSGNRMLGTVNDIIDISKIDAGQMELSNDAINIVEEINILYDFFQEEARAKGINIRLFNSMGEESSMFITDKNKLNSIISNLIKNAIKYTDKGTIDIYCIDKDQKFEFKIIDTGIGIPKNRIQSIFNRFEQADIEDTHAREGSGLGLSITKAYVKMLNGSIGVDSKPGYGSTFYFTLPWNNSQQKPDQIEEKVILTKTNADKKLNILIAEDDDTSFEHLKIILTGITKSIKRVTNGEDAVSSVKINPDIDLILMDVKMPILGGYEATTMIRNFNNDVIIIAQTAYALIGDKENAIASGCTDYIAKPIDSKELLKLINKHFN